MRRDGGFTLLEIILATSLFVLLMSSYYTVFIHVVELEEYARNQRAIGAVGPAVLDLVEDDMLSVYTHPKARDAFPFRGRDDALGGEAADKMDFVAHRASIHREDFHGEGEWVYCPVNEVGYRLARNRRDSGNVRRLYRRESYYVDSSPLDGGDYYEIYDRVVAFDVKYVGFRVEEEERSDQDTLGETAYELFESWDSEERKALPTAVVLTLTIEPPRLTDKQEIEVDEAERLARRRTFFRVVHLVQADDIQPPEGGDQPASPQR